MTDITGPTKKKSERERDTWVQPLSEHPVYGASRSNFPIKPGAWGCEGDRNGVKGGTERESCKSERRKGVPGTGIGGNAFVFVGLGLKGCVLIGGLLGDDLTPCVLLLFARYKGVLRAMFIFQKIKHPETKLTLRRDRSIPLIFLSVSKI